MKASVFISLYTCLLILTLFTVVKLSFSKPQELTTEEVRRQIYEAYERVVEAKKEGANVTQLISKLNYAITLIKNYEEGMKNPTNLVTARKVALEVRDEAEELREITKRENFERTVLLVFTAIIAAIMGYLIYIKVSRWYWRFRTERIKEYGVIWKVEGKTRGREREEVYAVVLAILIVVGVFAVANWLMAGRVVEPFSALGVLGPKMKIGDYPREVIVGEPFLLHIYVHNYMGKPMYYFICIKLGNKSTPIDPSPLKPFKVIERILDHNETWVFPVKLSINETGINHRLIFELWVYNDTTKNVTYHGIWCQLWINVTGKTGYEAESKGGDLTFKIIKPLEKTFVGVAYNLSLNECDGYGKED